MRGSMIRFQGNGNSYDGYLAVPESGSGPGVIVLQEWWGLVGHIKSVADRFAEAGFVALAPDLYLGKTADEPEEAGKLMMALNIAETEKVLSGAVDALSSQPGVISAKIGVVGFCMGGQLSLFAACINPKIGACVDFYGIHPNVHPDWSRLNAPVLGFFAEHDAYASPAAVAVLGDQLSEAGKAFEFKTYRDTHHAFFNDDRPGVYSAEAAADSWARMNDFFRTNLV